MSGVVEWIGRLGTWSTPFWPPVLIWTVLAGSAMVSLSGLRRLHPVLQEKARTGILIALPLGVLVAMLVVTGSVSLPRAPVPVPEWVVVPGGELPAGPGSPGSLGSVEPSSAPPPAFWWGVLLLAALATTGVAAARTARDVVVLRRLRGRLRDLGPEDFGLLLDTGNGDSRRTVRIGALNDDIVPMTFGIVRPVVVVPERLVDDPRALRIAIAHELVHVRRGDILVHTIEHLMTLLFAFHPLVHWLRRQAQRYREMACDAEVIGSGCCQPDEYAELLLRMATPAVTSPAAAVGIGRAFTDLKRRITTMQKNTRIASGPPRRASWLIGMAMATTTVSAVACADLGTGPGPDPVTRGQVEFSAANYEAALVEADNFYGGRLLVYFRSPDAATSAAVERYLFGNSGYARHLTGRFARYSVPVDTDEARSIMERYNVTSRTESPLLLLVDGGRAMLMTTLDDVVLPEAAARKMGQVRAAVALTGIGAELNSLSKMFRTMGSLGQDSRR